jgi:hypothetical protein
MPCRFPFDSDSGRAMTAYGGYDCKKFQFPIPLTLHKLHVLELLHIAISKVKEHPFI